MRPKSGYTKDEYTAEVVRLWEDVVRTVYLKVPTVGAASPEAERAWDGTTMTPIRYVMWLASPHHPANMILRGQKAREKRWKKWLKGHGLKDTRE